MGDMNYHCADITATEALGFIRQGRSRQLLVDHDELLKERASNQVRGLVYYQTGAPRFRQALWWCRSSESRASLNKGSKCKCK